MMRVSTMARGIRTEDIPAVGHDEAVRFRGGKFSADGVVEPSAEFLLVILGSGGAEQVKTQSGLKLAISAWVTGS